jgi:hypothetical protein
LHWIDPFSATEKEKEKGKEKEKEREKMLTADRLELQTSLEKNSLDIRERELRFFVDSTNAVSSQSALLLGFAFTALVEGVIESESSTVKFLWILSLVVSLTSNLFVIVLVTVMTVWGENLALRGPDGSMDKAVIGMREQRMIVYYFFGAGLAGFVVASCVYAWGNFSTLQAVLATVLLGVGFMILLMHCRELLAYYRLPTAAISSALKIADAPLAVAPTQDANSFSDRQHQQHQQHQQQAKSEKKPLLSGFFGGK